MIIVFRNETHNVKLLSVDTCLKHFFAYSTWMCCELGEGEEEVENQGRSRVKVSSQGTDLKCQRSLSMRAKADQKEAVKQEIVKQLSTGCTTDSNSTPHFSSFNVIHKSRSPSLHLGRHSAAMHSVGAPRISSISEMTSFSVFSGWFSLKTSLGSFASQTSKAGTSDRSLASLASNLGAAGSSPVLTTNFGNFYA